MSRRAIYLALILLVCAISAVARISASNTGSATLPAPQNVTLSGTTEGIDVRWNIPPGSDEVANYQIAYQATERQRADSWTYMWTQGKTSTHLIRHLAGGYEYRVYVRSCSTQCNSEWAYAGTVRTQKPNSPTPKLTPVPTSTPIPTPTPTATPVPTTTPTPVLVHAIWPTSTPWPTPIPTPTRIPGSVLKSNWIPQNMGIRTYAQGLLVRWKDGWGRWYENPVPDYMVAWRDLSHPNTPDNWSFDTTKTPEYWIGGLTNGKTYAVYVKAFRGDETSDWVSGQGTPLAVTPTPTRHEGWTCFGPAIATMHRTDPYRPAGRRDFGGFFDTTSTFLNPRAKEGLSTWQYGFKFKEWGNARYALYLLVNNDRTWTFELRGKTNRVLDSGVLDVRTYDDRVSDPVSIERWSGLDYCYWPSQYQNALRLVAKDKYDIRFFVNDVEVHLDIDEEVKDLLEETLYLNLYLEYWVGDGRYFEGDRITNGEGSITESKDLWDYRVPSGKWLYEWILRGGRAHHIGGVFEPVDHRRP